MKKVIKFLGKENKKMKKSLLILGLALILVLAVTANAMAARPYSSWGTATNKHGSYTTNTDACGGCHKTHTAPYINLVGISTGTVGKNDTYDLCMYCHDSVGESRYDVEDGKIQYTAAGPINYKWASGGGGILNNVSIEGISVVAEQKAAVSKHNVDLANGSTLQSVATKGGSPTHNIDLTCGACHDPHGTGSYRTLKTTISTYLADDITAQTITVGTIANAKTEIANGEETYAYSDGKFNTFCGACHLNYQQTTVNGDTDYKFFTASTAYKRHKLGTLPNTAGNPGYDATKLVLPLDNGTVTCITCHFAHGSSADMTKSGTGPLLRMDERGVCQNCHNKNAYATAPTLIDRNGATAGEATLSSDFTYVTATFGAYMLKSGAETVANWTITGPAPIPTIAAGGIKLQPDGKSVVVRLNAAVSTAGTYTLKVNVANAVKDTNGVAAPITAQATFIK